MSTENVTAFFNQARNDEALAARVNALFAEADAAVTNAFTALSQEIGLPFTAEDLFKEQEVLLSDASLAEVSGGVTNQQNNNIIGYVDGFFGRRIPVQSYIKP